jgi:ketosteroid isomerase-like protein
MSEENVEIVRRWWAESSDWFNDPKGGDPERLAEISARYASEDVVFEEDPVWPDAGTYRGRDAIMDRFLEYFDVLQMHQIEIGEVIDADDVVYLEFRAHMGLGADAGQTQTFLWGYTVKVEEGRVVHFRAWFDPEEGRRAAGLSE